MSHVQPTLLMLAKLCCLDASLAAAVRLRAGTCGVLGRNSDRMAGQESCPCSSSPPITYENIGRDIVS